MEAVAHKAITLMPVESSQIMAIGHDAESNTLAIQFTGKNGPGSLYHYQNFTFADFAAFAGAESVGKHFYAHIKPFAEKYPYERVDALVPCDEAERQRLQGLAGQFLADRLPRPESICARDARIDSGDEEGPSDEDIIEFGKEWNLSRDALVARLEKFVVDQRELAEAA